MNFPKCTTLDKWLKLPTQDINHLRLLLRERYLRHDAENVYIRWFLLCIPSKISIFSYNESSSSSSSSSNSWEHNLGYRFNSAIITKMDDLENATYRFIQRAGNFFFILTDGVQMELMRDILENVWIKYNVYKIYVLTQDRGILIFDPFDYDSVRMRYGQIMEYNGEQRLERLLFRNMRGYPLRVQIFRSVYARPQFNLTTGKIMGATGVDGEVARMLEKRMNFTLILQEPNPQYFGERDKNGKYNGAIGSLLRDEIDLCLTGFFVKDYLVPDMSFTVAVYDDQLCIYVPKASRIPQSILPIFAVSLNVWASFILAAIGCAIIWWFFRLLNLHLRIKSIKRITIQATIKLHPHLRMNHWWQFMRIYIDTWVVWVRINIVCYPPFHSERVLLASLCLVSVIFGAIFESSLATVYIHPLYYRDINTLHELDQSGLKIVYKYASMADDLFFSETSLLFANLNKKLVHVHNLNADVILDVAENGGKAAVTRYTSLMLESQQFIVSKRIWVVPECPKYYTMSYVMHKYSPWEDSINRLLLRFLNAGLFNKWISDMEAEVNRKIMKKHIFESSDTFKILTVADVQLAFYVIFIGSTMGIVSLIFEYILKRFFNY